MGAKSSKQQQQQEPRDPSSSYASGAEEPSEGDLLANLHSGPVLSLARGVDDTHLLSGGTDKVREPSGGLCLPSPLPAACSCRSLASAAGYLRRSRFGALHASLTLNGYRVFRAECVFLYYSVLQFCIAFYSRRSN